MNPHTWLKASFARIPVGRRIPADAWPWALWGLLALWVFLARLGDLPSVGSVFNVYRDAALRWQSGQDLYPAELNFNYFPTFAAFFAPVARMPFAVGDAVWHMLNIVLFALGVRRMSGLGARAETPARFLIASLVTILLSASAARHGQATLAMAGLMLFAVADVECRSPWRAAVFSVLAVAVKPPAVVLMLVLVAVYPRLLWRTAVALAIVFCGTLFLQAPDYVLHQYAAVPDMLLERGRRGGDWDHLFRAFSGFGWDLGQAEQTLIRGAGAILVLLLCWLARRRAPTVGPAFATYTFAASYILLLGSGTEGNTYAMMGPIIGLLAASAWQDKAHARFVSMAALTAGCVFSRTIHTAFPGTTPFRIQPVVCLALFVLVALRLRPRGTS